MDRWITGWADTNVRFCPYCGEQIEDVNGNGECTCSNCTLSFYVIES